MRWLIASLALLLGVAQAVDLLTLRSWAHPGAWVRFVPDRVALPVEQLATESAWWPQHSLLDVGVARAALAGLGAPMTPAQRAGLAQTAEGRAVAGSIAERRGDLGQAFEAYLATLDADGAERVVLRLADQGKFEEAIRLQQRLIAATDAPSEAQARADAWWHLGELQRLVAYHTADPRHQRALELAAQSAFERAHHISPLSLKFALSAANESLELGELASARRAFESIVAIAPTSSDALLGLARVALASNDLVSARSYLSRAIEIGGRTPASKRVAKLLNE